MRHGCLVLIGIVVLLAAIGQCSKGTDNANETALVGGSLEEAKPVTLADLEKKLGDGAVETMTSEEYPKLYAKLGSAAFKRANDLAKWAAIAAAESPACDQVDIAAVSDRSTRSELEWFVDCANGERFRPTETEVRATRQKWQQAKGAAVSVADSARPQSAALANISEVEAVSMCDLAVKEGLKSKSSFDPAWSWDFRQHPAEGRVSVVREFEAQNAFGATLTSEYRCLIDASSKSFIEISIREPTSGWEVIYSR